MNKDNEWIRQHFEELVDRYPGKFVAVVNEELVAIGDSGVEVEKKVKEKYCNSRPSILKIPKPEDFNCVLSK